MIVEENLHIRFNEITPNVVGRGPDWLFDIDALTRKMNYEPIVAGTQSNGFAGTKASDNAGQARKVTEHVKDYILLPLWTADPPFSQDQKSSHDDGSKPSGDDGKKVDEYPRKDSECNDQEKEDNVNNTNNVNAASTNEVNVVRGKTSIELPDDLNMPTLEDYSIFDVTRNDEDPILTTRIHKDHPLDQVIGDLQSATQTRNMSKNLKEHGKQPKRLIHALKDQRDRAMQEELYIQVTKMLEFRVVIQELGESTTTTATITTADDITLARALIEIKSTKPKEKGVVIQELGESTTTISSQLSSQQSHDKGKGILIEPVKPMKKKDLIRLNVEAALKLQAEFDEEERLVKIDVDHQLAERLQAPYEQVELSIDEKLIFREKE
ncbi:hypothetical protein Tco_0834225 [Tanacetum coccineum]